MPLDWTEDGAARDLVARDMSGAVVIRITRRSVGEPVRWFVLDKGAVLQQDVAASVTAARRVSVNAYLRLLAASATRPTHAP